ncbi:hypothetical protein BSL78_22956 [Apostichopus japonicus]|uniref:Protein SCAI n=1 Tax=Stichopus japonicus TaxID=307972 RepID=A0A2G8JWU4_STIJA|nr:hypothetical protein BSL78_22956 [Apostichopus japonicus]
MPAAADLPQYGNIQWQSYFARSFDVYTKLWKYQQDNREVLENVYGLKRWQIGEIASKIGQLYYHYYDQRERLLFKAQQRNRSELVVKKLRYYARNIVVCLLLRLMDNVKELTKELKRFVEEYKATPDVDDGPEWSLVLGEVEAFVEADQLVTVLDEKSRHITVTNRFKDGMLLSADSTLMGHLKLQDALIVGNCHEQVKFSELTLDMYHMLQTLEREPTLSRDTSKEANSEPRRRSNPHKYLLYKPTFSQFTTYLSTAMKELPEDGALLLYLSADAARPPPQSKGEDVAYDMGGVSTNIKQDGRDNTKRKSVLLKDANCIHPGDLYPFTRRPLFLVVESPTSDSFRNFPNLFGQPLVSLMSPSNLPNFLQDDSLDKGNLFTVFLHSPLAGFCCVSSIPDVQVELWTNCQAMVNKILAEMDSQIVKSKTVDVAFKQFFSDDFLRLLILRFCFCHITLKYHRGFKDSTYYPQSFPDLQGHDVLELQLVHKLLLDLAAMLDVRPIYLEREIWRIYLN